MKEVGQNIAVEPAQFETTMQRLDRESAEAKERQRLKDVEAFADNQRAQYSAAYAADEKKRAKQTALEAEAEAADKAKRLLGEIESLKSKVAGLKKEVATEREVVGLPAEVADLKKWIASNPLASATPAQLDQITRLRLLIELWPERKKFLAAQIPQTEQQIKNAELEFAATQSLFEKAKAAVARLLQRDGAA